MAKPSQKPHDTSAASPPDKSNVPAEQKSNLPAVTADASFEAFAGHGFENVTASDILIPRLTILQALSPQLKRNKAEFIDGAKAGQICDVGTGEVFPGPVLFLPVFYRKDWLEWAPRSSGKGLVAIHPDASIVEKCGRNDKNQPVLPNGNIVMETAQWFGLNMTADARRCFLPMASTQLKRSKRWMTLATSEKLNRPDGSSFTPPLFFRTYQLSVAEESKDDNDWFVWKIDRDKSLPELGGRWMELRDLCVAFREQLATGAAQADTRGMGGDPDATDASAGQHPDNDSRRM